MEHKFAVQDGTDEPTVIKINDKLLEEMGKDADVAAIAEQIKKLIKICDKHEISATFTLDPKRDKTIVDFDRDDGMNAQESIILATEIAAAGVDLLRVTAFVTYDVEAKEVASSKNGKRRAYATSVTRREAPMSLDLVSAIVVLDKDGLYLTSFDDHRNEFYPAFKDKELCRKLTEYCRTNDWKQLVRSKLKGIMDG